MDLAMKTLTGMILTTESDRITALLIPLITEVVEEEIREVEEEAKV